MAGHSKWANIKFRKAGQDAKRGKLFTKFIREITASVRLAGPDPNSNPSLRTAIEKALAGNMTRDTIDRAIKRADGGEGETNLEAVRYEGYGVNGVAVIVDCLTNNRNRTVGEVRHAFSKHGGNLGISGSVAYLFNKLGQIILDNDCDQDKVLELAIEAGADEVEPQEDGSVEIQTQPDEFEKVRDALKAAGYNIAHAEVTMLAAEQIELDPEASATVLKLVDRLEDLDDVQSVYTNASFNV